MSVVVPIDRTANPQDAHTESTGPIRTSPAGLRATVRRMVLFQAQVILAADSTIPADVAINTWHFNLFPQGEFGGIPEISLEQIITGERDLDLDENGINGDLSDFYATIGNLLSTEINPATSRIKWYNLDEPKPRKPFLELPMKPFVTGTGAIPAEVAIVASFEANPVSGVNQATRRNRVYLGPLSTAAVQDSNNALIRTPWLTLITGAMENLAQNSFDQGRWYWAVHSETTGATEFVQRGWVDNAWDSQRRRGVEASTRVTFTQDAAAGQ